MLNVRPLSTLIHDQASKYGDRIAMKFRNDATGNWDGISWKTFSDTVRMVSHALLELGVEVQENIAVFSQNTPQGLCVDFGGYAIRAVTIPFYATSSEMQVKYMVSDANIRYIFVGEQYQYDTALRVQKLDSHVKKLVMITPGIVRDEMDQTSITWEEFLALGEKERKEHEEEVKKRTAELVSEDLANILYTSGTTGLSKGVMITHLMYNSAIAAHDGVLPLTEHDVVMNFLPFTHIFERAWTYLCLTVGATLAVNFRPQDILKSLNEVHPTCMSAVPRFWEKVYSGVKQKIEESSAIERNLMNEALRVGRKYNVEYLMQGKKPPLGLQLQYKFYEKTLIELLLQKLGLERHNFFPTAGAAIPREIEEFVHSCGINMVAGYGLTESTATVSCDRYNLASSLGSVGRILPGLEIKFGENNEVLLRGNTITKGYYRKQEVTDLSIDEEGWFHTGDAGYMKNGELFLTDRIKDLFKTSNGKYIAPQLIESKLCVDKYIDQIVIIADQRKFVSALVIPEYRLLEEFAKEYNIEYKDVADLCANPKINKFMMYRIDTIQQEFAHYEQVKKVTLLPEPFSLEKGELTNTLKVKRPVLNQNYREQIEKMYEE